MDVEAIHQADYNVGGWLMTIEGCPLMFTNIPDLVGGGLGSWIDDPHREVILGLVMPRELRLGETDPYVGRIVDAQATFFGLEDYRGRVAELFKSVEPDATTDYMGSRLSPLQDPAPEFVPGQGGLPIPIWGRHIGPEAIGPAGERRHLWCFPEDTPPGLDHFAGPGWPPSLITDSPTSWPGRKIAIYRVVRDEQSESWPSWLEQHQGGSLWWYGALKDVGTWRTTKSGGRRLDIGMFGPVSWLRKPLGLSRPTKALRPSSGVVLEGDEVKVAMWIERLDGVELDEGIAIIPSTYQAFTLAQPHDLSGLVTREEVAQRLQDLALTLVKGVDSGPVLGASAAAWTGPEEFSQGFWGLVGNNKRKLQISSDGGTIGIKCESQAAELGYALGIAMTAKVWQLLGWDVNAPQFSKGYGVAPVGGVHWGEPAGANLMPAFHYIGRFSTRPGPDALPSKWANGGNWRSYVAPYPGGTVTLNPAGGDELRLQVGEAHCEGQLAQPYTIGATIDGTPVNATGWWLFRGQRLTASAYLAGELEPEDFEQVALCEWVSTASGDGVEIDDLGFARVRVVRWENPKRFGFDHAPMAEPWVSVLGGLEVTPLSVLGGITPGAPGWRHRIIPSVLLSSGTAKRIEIGGEVRIEPGANQPEDVPATDIWPGDVEAADLGLGLPPALVDWASWYKATASIPGGHAGALNRVLYTMWGTVRASQIVSEAMAGAGLAWSWKRKAGGMVPAFGAFDPLASFSVNDITATIRREDLVEPRSPSEQADPMWRSAVDLRRGGPYDRFKIQTQRAPLTGSLEHSRTYESQDPGRRFRDGRHDWKVEDGGMRDPTPWLGLAQSVLYDWTGLARQRFAVGYGQRHARQLRIWRGTIHPRFTGQIGLGSTVRVTDPTAPSPDGSVGVDHFGLVLEASIVSRGKSSTALRVAVELVHAANTIKVFGPSAQGGVSSWDAASNTLHVTEDWARLGEDHRDVAGFVQPSWSTEGAGPLRVKIFQSENGRDYPDEWVATGDVVAIDEAANTIEITNLAGGQILRDTIKWVVGADYIEQTTPWALAIFMPITEETGQVAGEKGTPL